MCLKATVCCRVGQQSQDGGKTVELLLHVLWQLLILLIPACKQKGFSYFLCSATLKKKKKVKGDVVLCDPAIWRRVRDAGNSGLHHQLRPIVELDPHLSARQLVAWKHPLDQTIPLLIPEYLRDR